MTQKNEEIEDFIDLTASGKNTNGNLFTYSTDKNTTQDECMQPMEHDDVIITLDNADQYAGGIDDYSVNNDDDIPDNIYWVSLLGVLECCTNELDLVKVATEMKKEMRPLRLHKKNIYFRPEIDVINAVAMNSMPDDGPQNVDMIKIPGVGNCMCWSISHSFSGNDKMHVEIRVRTVVEGIVNKDMYVNYEVLSRGANLISGQEELPVLYTKYSDHYVNGQKVTRNTVDYVYFCEMHDCTKITFQISISVLFTTRAQRTMIRQFQLK